MAAGGAAGDPDRGGAQIPAPTAPRSRLSLTSLATPPAAGAVVLELGLAAYPVLVVHGVLRTALAMLGLGAVGLLLGGLLARTTGPLPWSIGLLAISAAVAMLARGISVERLAPVWGPGLLLAGELAWWAVDRASLPREPAGVARHRVLLVVTMTVAAAVLTLLVISAGGLTGAASGLDVRVLGVGAVVMVAWTLAVLTRRAGGR